MLHTVLVADSINACAMMAALHAQLQHELLQSGDSAYKRARGGDSIEDQDVHAAPKARHFGFFVSRDVTLIYIKDLSAAGTNQYAASFWRHACTALERRLRELTTEQPDWTVHVIGLTEHTVSPRQGKAWTVVLGQDAPAEETTVAGTCGAIYEWCRFCAPALFPRYTVTCSVVLLQHPNGQVYPFAAYAELYLSAAPLRDVAVPRKKAIVRRIDEFVQVYMNSISLVYI